MVSKTNEAALENLITQHLVDHQGYVEGISKDFNKRYAIDEKLFWKFLENTQSKELEKLKCRDDDWQRKVLERLDRLLKKHGILQLLKRGLSIDDAHLHLMYPAPLASSSEKVKQDFEENIFSCTRQIPYSIDKPSETIDIVLFINGLPFTTLELKNPWTGQTARYHGQKQYRNDRDNSQQLLQFGRCLVHMAVDTDEAYMATKLAGKDTFFLPFNKGNNGGAGNPTNPQGHKTSYLWEEIFAKDSISNIIQNFVSLDGSDKDRLEKRTLFFPRYHQLDVVRQIITHASENGIGHRYLIQHSAGSGKSNSITWAAYQLIGVYPKKDSLQGSLGLERPLFDSVIVVTDRRILDRQLRDNIKEFSEVKSIVSHAHKSSELKESLERGKKIIITTIQKFPFIIDGIGDLKDKRFAVIIDEAHSSQSGAAHDNMNKAMGKELDLDTDNIQDKVLDAMRSRKMRNNASYFAFTATPKNTTLEKFGIKHQDGSFHPFHLYTMKQAIEEGFILDVLANYTIYKSYYEIQKSIEGDPLFDTNKAQKKLKSYVEKNPSTIRAKAEIMLDHFISSVVNNKKLKGKARGMVITRDIESAVHYYHAIKELLAQIGNPFKAIVSFSGTKLVDGIEYKESDINGFSDDKTKEYFDGYDQSGKPITHNGTAIENTYRLLVVANKYLTGFDQPKLTSMYVDKRLQGVMCVQALSRLNRSSIKLGKRTEDLFILDFFNSIDDIKNAFDGFYTSTSLSEATDVNVLHDLESILSTVGVYEQREVEEFTNLYFNNVDAQELSPLIDQASERFNQELGLEEKEKADFKIKAKHFVKIYGQMAAIIPFEIAKWEKLFWFLKFLIPKLVIKDQDADKIDELLQSVDLSCYGLERIKLNHSIELDSSSTELSPQSPNPRGAHGAEGERDRLDIIIEEFNKRWRQEWGATPEEQRVKLLNIAEDIRSHAKFESKYQNNDDKQNRELALNEILDKVMKNNREKDLELYRLWAKDEDFKDHMKNSLREMVR